jgi:hypothetical protein
MSTPYGNIAGKIAGEKMALGSRVQSKRVAETLGIDYGYPVFGYVGNDKDIFKFHNNVAVVTYDADFVASNSIALSVDSVAITAVVFNTNHDTTMTDLKEQIQADITGAVVTLTDATNNRQLTITIEDDGDRVATSTVTGGASQAVATITYSSSMIFKGLTMITHQESAPKTDLEGNVLEAGDALYELKDAANVMIDGAINVVTGAAVSSGKQAYVVATGAEQGKITDVDTDNIILSGVTINETVDSAGIAEVRINN